MAGKKGALSLTQDSVCLSSSLIYKFHSLFGSQRHRDLSVFPPKDFNFFEGWPGKNERSLLHRTWSTCSLCFIFNFHSHLGSQSPRVFPAVFLLATKYAIYRYSFIFRDRTFKLYMWALLNLKSVMRYVRSASVASMASEAVTISGVKNHRWMHFSMV